MALEVQAENNSVSKFKVPTHIPQEIFRAYDIRGSVDENNLTADVAFAIGLAVGSETLKIGENTLIVGRDGRVSGPLLHSALCEGIRMTGCHIIDIGRVPTPLLYFATNTLASIPVEFQKAGEARALSRSEWQQQSQSLKGDGYKSGIMITASHNPGHHNGFKIVLNGKSLTADGINLLYNRILEKQFFSGEGSYQIYDSIVADYINFVTAQIKLSRPLKVVVDCGNGIAGEIVPTLYRKIGCEVIELYCEVDGAFPNHHPDPTVPENLIDLINLVKSQGADLGLAFDGDADRLGIVTNKGEIIWPDRQLMIFAEEILSRLPNSKIIFDVKCTKNLAEVIQAAGGIPIMCRTGHSIIKNKMLEEQAPLAGEMSGHIFFKDQWFGFDDGLYVGSRLLKILADQEKSCNDFFADLPDSINTPELKLPISEQEKAPFMYRLVHEATFGEKQRITIDGLRVEFDYGWGLIRPSNTSPYLILRFEADTKENLEKIKQVFRSQLLMLDSKLELPF